MRNVHDDAPVLMKTRWALSFLRGPLTGPEIARAMADAQGGQCRFERGRAGRRCATRPRAPDRRWAPESPSIS